jgi:hypothetical protein
VHRGDVVGDAGWPALVDAERFDRVQARLEARRGVRQKGTARLLTGVARCGVCGAKMTVGKDRMGRRFYQCRGGQRDDRRFCVARDLTHLEAWVTVVVLERLARPDVAEALSDSPDPAAAEARTRVDELRARLDDATGEFVAGRLSASTLAKVEAELGEQIAEAERAARAALVPLDVDVPATGVDGWWDGLTVEQQREVVGALIAAVTVRPVGRGRRDYDPAEFTSVEWRR